MKFFRFIEYAYLAAFIFFLYEAYEAWKADSGKEILYLLFAGVAVFMFFFKRSFRKKLEARNNDNS